MKRKNLLKKWLVFGAVVTAILMIFSTTLVPAVHGSTMTINVKKIEKTKNLFEKNYYSFLNLKCFHNEKLEKLFLKFGELVNSQLSNNMNNINILEEFKNNSFRSEVMNALKNNHVDYTKNIQSFETLYEKLIKTTPIFGNILLAISLFLDVLAVFLAARVLYLGIESDELPNFSFFIVFLFYVSELLRNASNDSH